MFLPVAERGKELADKIKIKIKAFVRDLKQGVDDRALMEKYNLSAETLPKLLDKLVNQGIVTESDLETRYMFDSTQRLADLFSFPYDSNDS